MKRRSWAFVWTLSLAFSLFVGSAVFAEEAVEPGVPKSDWSFKEAGLLPMQNGGRLKPLDTFAREMVLYLTGSKSYSGWRPVDLLFSWMTAPSYWENQKFIKLDRKDVKRQLLLDETQSRFSPKELLGNGVLAQYVTGVNSQQTTKLPISQEGRKDPREEELKALVNRLAVYASLLTGEGWTVIPRPGEESWANLASPPPANLVGDAFKLLVKAYYRNDQTEFERQSTLVRATIHGEVPGFKETSENKILAEYYYYQIRPFNVAWVLYLLAGVLWVFVIVTKKGTEKAGFRGSMVHGISMAGFLMHTFGFVLRIFVSGRAPVTNMYESVVWVSWGVMLFGYVIWWMQRQRVVASVACFVAALGLIIADAAPAVMDPGIQTLVPVLRSNLWLTIHVLSITLGYAAFGLAFGLGVVTLYHFIRFDLGRGPQEGRTRKIFDLNTLIYRSQQFGVVLLAAGTILGGVWADYSWGRFWGWDPKETWALIALLVYIAVLHARYTGWVGEFSFPAWSVVCFLSVVMAWYGVNFVLGVGLHSYGFVSGGGVVWVGLSSLAILVYVLAAWVIHRRRKSA